jgi:predicted permease
VNTTTFTLVNALLFRLPAFSDPGGIVQIYRTTPQSQFDRQAPANMRDMMEQTTVFQQVAPYCINNANLAKPGQPAERVSALNVAGNFFELLGVAPILGRGLTPADDRPGHADVAVVSESFWREKLGGSPSAVGSSIRLDGKPITVVGVMPGGCQDLMSFGIIGLWQPLGYGEEQWRIRDNAWLSALARVKPGIGIRQVQAELNTVAARLAHDYPTTNAANGLNAIAYGDARSGGGTRQICWIIMGLTLSVLLIACVNLANLQLARTAGRLREHAVRIALGASRAQLIRQLLTESVMLSMTGGLLGLLVAAWGNRLLGSRINTDFASNAAGFDLPLDYRVLGFMFLASVGTGVVFGLMPAWIASGTNVNIALKQGSRGTTGDRSKHLLRQVLVVAELSLALALLAGAAFFVRGSQRFASVQSGWRTDSVLSGYFVLPYTAKYSTDVQLRAAVDSIESRLAGLPGVDHAAVSGSIPVFYFSHSGNFVIEGQPPPPHGREPFSMIERVTPDYFSTLGIHLLAGRGFSAADRADSRKVVVVDAALARQFWPAGDAIGHRIGDTDPKKPDWREVVGIVNEVQLAGNPSIPNTHFQIYRPFTQDAEHWLALSVHTGASTGGVAEAIIQAVARVDPDVAVFGLASVQSSIERAGNNMALVGQLLTLAAVLGLLLALIGIYGVIANLASQRTQEIGIRMALGAQAKSVLWLILRNGIRLATIGTGLGLLLAFGATWVIGRMIPTIPGQDPLLVVGLALLLVGATLLASWLPARRATLVNPVDALRGD